MRQPRFVKISSKKSVCFVLFLVVKYNAEFIMERSCQMIETNGKKLFRGEAALALAVLINSFGVVLMLYSGAGILSLMIMRKKFVTSYLFSFAVGFVFSELADIAKIAYPKIKIGFDVTCLAVTAGLTFFCLGRIDGLGIGTILGIAGDIIDKQFYFKSFMSKKQQA